MKKYVIPFCICFIILLTIALCNPTYGLYILFGILGWVSLNILSDQLITGGYDEVSVPDWKGKHNDTLVVYQPGEEINLDKHKNINGAIVIDKKSPITDVVFQSSGFLAYGDIKKFLNTSHNIIYFKPINRQDVLNTYKGQEDFIRTVIKYHGSGKKLIFTGLSSGGREALKYFKEFKGLCVAFSPYTKQTYEVVESEQINKDPSIAIVGRSTCSDSQHRIDIIPALNNFAYTIIANVDTHVLYKCISLRKLFIYIGDNYDNIVKNTKPYTHEMKKIIDDEKIKDNTCLKDHNNLFKYMQSKREGLNDVYVVSMPDDVAESIIDKKDVKLHAQTFRKRIHLIDNGVKNVLQPGDY